MGASFGTDGLRGVANADLTPELALALGRAAARRFRCDEFLVGRDTRISGSLLSAALAAGLSSEGTSVCDAGVIPTPGLAWLSAERGVPAAMVSASHNPFADNGIKLFGPGGTKVAGDVERGVESELAGLTGGTPEGAGRGPGAVGAGLGVIGTDPRARLEYTAHLARSVPGLGGSRVVVDCANGAASGVAPEVLRRLGAEVGVIAAEPDGTNINDRCGSTHPETLQQAVLDQRADVGLAFDGDADRVVAADHRGRLVDGDHLISLFATDLLERGELAGAAVVVTVMSNLGLHRAMERAGIAVRQTAVGDRYVLEELERSKLVLGGEQSGHIIFRRLATTGDGILTGVLLLDLLRRHGRSLAELAAGAMTRLPQELVNVAVDDPSALETSQRVWDEVAAVEAELGAEGRVLLRPSGTEPLVRVMVEATSPEKAASSAAHLGEVVARELAANT